MAKERIKAITNLIIALVLLVNAILTAMGKSPLPFSEGETQEMVSYALSVIGTLWAWWKNNNLTVEAETGQQILNELKKDKDKVGQESDLKDPEEE